MSQQYETAQFMPEPNREELSGELVCYARYGRVPGVAAHGGRHPGQPGQPVGVEMFKTVKQIEPESNAEQAAYSKWLDQTSDRESARNDRLHGAVGVIPTSLWLVLLFSAGVIFGTCCCSPTAASRGSCRPRSWAAWRRSWCRASCSSTCSTARSTTDAGGLKPVAMERTLRMLAQQRDIGGHDAALRRRGQPDQLTRRPTNLLH